MPGDIRPVAVTGIGIISPLGRDAASHWQAAIAGHRCIRRLDPRELSDPAIFAEGWSDWAGAPVAGCNAMHSTGDVAMHASDAATQARQQAGFMFPPEEIRRRMGVVFGASKPTLQIHPDFTREVILIGGQPCPGDSELFNLSASGRGIACRGDLTGPVLTPSAACATGLVSIIRGAELIRDGACDIVIAGSADSSLHAAYLAAYRRMGVLAHNGNDPGRSCRPFDARRDGFAVGEGAAALILEDIDHARRRGATILAEILGAGLTSDNDSLVDVDPSGQALARALGDALKRSGVEPRQIDAVSVHGTGTRLNDVCETSALKRVCGEHAHRISCFSLKGAIGHLMGAAGSVETATLIQAMQHGIVPPTVNLEEPDPDCDLDYTPGQPRTRPINLAVKLSLGFGGTCAALVIRRPESP
jgi:3-oxoacyl-[acyl-carrier-protein] synthase II